MVRRSLSCWDWLRVFPPAVVRLAARTATAGKNVRALSHREIAIAANIPLVRVEEISGLLSWETVTLGEAERFVAACGFDPTNAKHRHRQREYLRVCQTKYPGQPPHYLRSSPLWSLELLPLIRRIKSPMKSSVGSNPSVSPSTKYAA
jgi:hypothetical protein